MNYCIFLFFVLSLNISTVLYCEAPSWAEKTLHEMSTDEKIGQLFMIAAYVDSEYAKKETGNSNIIDNTCSYVSHYSVGGIAFAGPSERVKQINLTNEYQKASKYPILIAQDLEWGLSMRLKDGMAFPKNATLGAINDNNLIYQVGREIGRQAKLIGVHMNLSPVLDVNIEPENISINVRSFGADPKQVAANGVAMIQGLQDAGIIASAKHFPGLGDITTDPHINLPYNRHDKKRLREVEFYPFTKAIEAGVLSIQTEHLVIPAFSHTPASLSHEITTDLLKKELGFKGLILSGALRMRALTKHFSEHQIVLQAFTAGNDMLLMPQDFPKAHQVLKDALAEGKITIEEINKRVLKILQLKEKVGLHLKRAIDIPLEEEFHSATAQNLKQTLYRKAVKFRDREASLSTQKNDRIAYVEIGEPSSQVYFKTLYEQLPLDSFLLAFNDLNTDELQTLLQQLKKYDLILLTVYPMDPRRITQIRLLGDKHQTEQLKNFHVHGLPLQAIKLIDTLNCYSDKIIVALFGNSFGLPYFSHYPTVLMGYENQPEAELAAADILLIKDTEKTTHLFN